MNEHPSGADLSAYLDRALASDESYRIERHLQECARCRGELEGLENLERVLVSAWDHFYETECPSPHQLARHGEGMLPRDESAAIAEHLNRCALCQLAVSEGEGSVLEATDQLEQHEKLELLARRFVQLRLPDELTYFGLIWEKIKALIASQRNLPISEWIVEPSMVSSGALRFSGEHAEFLSPMIVAALLIIEAELRGRVISGNQLRERLEQISKQLGLPGAVVAALADFVVDHSSEIL